MMDDDELDPHTRWVVRTQNIGHAFAAECAKLRETRPAADEDELQHAIQNLMTELWDRNFSQTQIRSAFQAALDELPGYAAGHESRSEEERARQKGRPHLWVIPDTSKS